MPVLHDDKQYLRDPKVMAVVDQLIAAIAKDRPADVLRYIHQWEGPSHGSQPPNTNSFHPVPPTASRAAGRALSLSQCPYVLPIRSPAMPPGEIAGSSSTSPSLWHHASTSSQGSPKHAVEALRARVKAAASYGSSPVPAVLPIDVSRTAPTNSSAAPTETTPLMLPESSNMLTPPTGNDDYLLSGGMSSGRGHQKKNVPMPSAEIGVQTDISLGCTNDAQELIEMGLSTMGVSMGPSRRPTSAGVHSVALKTVASWTKGILSLPSTPNVNGSANFPLNAVVPSILRPTDPPPQQAAISSTEGAPLDGSVLVAGMGAFFSKDRPVKLKELKKIFPPPTGILGLVSSSGKKGRQSKPASPVSNKPPSTLTSPTKGNKKDFATRHHAKNRSSVSEKTVSSKKDNSLNESGAEHPSYSSLSSSMDFGGKEVSGQGNYGTVCQGVLLGNHQTAPTAASPLVKAIAGNPENQIVAIKITKIKDKWSLDEVEALRHCTQVASLVLSKGVGAPWQGINQQGEAEAHDTLTFLDENLVAGATRTITLVGQVCYDPRTHSLWIPLPWLPLTLDGLIQYRKKQLWEHDARPLKDPKPPLFALQEIQAVFKQMLQAAYFLGAAAKVAHLDIKPANVLITSPTFNSYDEINFGSNGKIPENVPASIVLCDCGLMQHIGDSLCQLGDYLYMSPEVYYCDVKEASRAKGEETDEDLAESWEDEEHEADDAHDKDEEFHHDNDYDEESRKAHKKDIHVFTDRNDIWSIGCVILEMMDGISSIAWEAADAFSAMKENYLAPAPKHVSQWPGDLVHCVSMCFERDPRLRFGAQELLTHPFFLNNFEGQP